jgi:DNA-directed RNA polymerase alpha subunit
MRHVDRVTIIRYLEAQINEHHIKAAMYTQMLSDFQSTREKHFNRLLEDMELTVRTINCMRAEGYIFIGDVASKSQAQLLKIPNLGKKSVTELAEMLHNLGIIFEDPASVIWVRPEHPRKPVVR